MIRSYDELVKIDNFYDRLQYLKVRDEEYDVPRSIIQNFYKSRRWLELRDRIILRDKFMDLGINKILSNDRIIVHHINPVTQEQLLTNDPILYDENNLVTTTIKTHNIIHYRNKKSYVERKEGDTILW